MSVKHGRAFTFTTRRTARSVELEPPLRVVKAQGLRQAGRCLLQIHLAHRVPRALKQPDLLLAEGQDIESPIAAEQRQQRLDVKAVGDNHQLLKVKGQAVVVAAHPRHLGRDKDRQSVALTLPEEAILDQPGRGFEQCPGRRRTETIPTAARRRQALFCFVKQVFQPDRILPSLRPCPVRGHKDGHVPAITLLAQIFQVISI